MKQNRQFNPYIHGLRGLAALMVFIFHIYRGAITAGLGHINHGKYFFPNDVLHNTLIPFLQTLNFGVELFFMISGFLITASLVYSKNIKTFFISRCVRLYPAFLPLVTLLYINGLYFGLMWIHDLNFIKAAYLYLLNILFIPGVFDVPIILPAAWTLSFEAVFYLTAATIYTFSTHVRPYMIALLVMVIGIFLLKFAPRATYFIVGTASYFLLQQKHSILAAISRIPLFPLCCFAFLLYGDSQAYRDNNHILYLLMNVAGLITFLAIAQGVGLFAKLMASSTFQFLGTISYSLYLWHVPVMGIIKRLLLKFAHFPANDYALFYSYFLLSTIATLVVAYFSYLIFEYHISKRLKLMLSKRRTKLAQATL